MQVGVCVFFFIKQYSPWYNHTGWLGVKHQVTYLLLNSVKERPQFKKNFFYLRLGGKKYNINQGINAQVVVTWEHDNKSDNFPSLF